MKTIQVKQPILVDKDKNNFVVNNTSTLALIMGTKGLNGNYHIYNITKKDGKFIVPINEIIKRRKVLEQRKAEIEKTLDVIKQLI